MVVVVAAAVAVAATVVAAAAVAVAATVVAVAAAVAAAKNGNVTIAVAKVASTAAKSAGNPYSFFKNFNPSGTRKRCSAFLFPRSRSSSSHSLG
jgi:hypothetical protein